MVANFVQGMRESASKVVKSSFTMPKDVSCLSRVSAQVCFALSLAISAPLHAEDIDMPIGGRIIEGEGSIIESGLLTTIQQNSNALIVDWDTFDIGINGRVDFIQPGANAIALNRIFDNKPSEIFGQLNSNGHIVLLNSYGILFGETASVNVGGLVATSLSISAEDFMNGDYVFSDLGEVSGSIINHGLINAATGGNVTLLGGRVENHGLIAANLGAVNLAAGREAVLTFDNQGLLGVKVTESVLQEDLGVDPAVINTGDINAAGGSILLTASASQDIFSQAVQVGDMAEAREAIINEDGSFTLTSRSNAQINTGSGNQLTVGADVVNSGSLDVSTDEEGEDAGEIQIVGENVTNSGVLLANAENGNGGAIAVESRDVTLVTDNSVISTRAENGLGGEIRILGDKVGVLDETVIDSSGRNGGGDILIGGDFQGSNSAIRNASRTYVGDDTEIYADALNEGDGGTVILWSDELTYFGGNIYTRGGQTAGDGGFVEISGKEQLLFRGETDRSAVNGVGGTLLLDPRDITIGTNNDDGGQISDNEVLFTDGGASEDFSISAAQIVAELVDGDVLLQAFRDLEVDSAIIANAGNTNNLTLQAGDDLRINAAIDLIAGDLSLMAGISCGTCSDLGADLVIDSTLNTSGSISLEAARDVFISAAIGGSAAPSSITVRAGDDINLNSGSSLTSAGNMVLTAADSSLVADGFWAVSSASGDINFNGGNITTNGGNFTASTEDGNFDFNSGDISTGGGDFSATTADGTIDINGNDIDTNGGAFLFSSSGDLDLDSGDITSNGGTINIRSSAGAVTLNGSNINSNTGDVLFSAEGNIEFRDGLVTTSGGNFVANSASGYFDNAFSNSDAIDAGAGSVTITSGGSYSVSGVGVYLGRITAGSLSVTTTGGSISQYTFAGQYLEINGTTTLNAGANSITLDVTDNELNGPIILTNTGANAVLINNSVDTTLGAVNVGGNLTIDSQQGLSLTDDLTVVGNAVFDFAQNNSNGNVFNVDTGLTIATGSLTVNGGTGNDQFDIGSDIGGQLNGDDGIDTFNILADVVTTTIDGGGGSDILVGNDSVNTNTWVVDSDNSGTLTNSSNVVSFSNLENLQGGSGVDTFTVTANLSSLDAGNGNNNITINNGGDVTGAVTAGDGDDTILLEDSTASAIVGSIDAGNGNNNITINNFGSVTGAIVTGTGIDTIVFTGNGTAGSLSTGAGDDVITIVDNSSVSGLIDGGADNDSVTITGSDVTITLGTDVANTETLTAGGGTNTLVGADNGGNTWLIDATNSVNDGTTTTVFSNFSILTAGNGGDDFTVNVAGIDTINGDTGDDVFTLLTAGLVGTINGNTGTDSLTVTSGDNTWSSDNNGDGNVFVTGVPADISNFTSVENLTGGSGTDSIDLTGFGSATIQLANYLNFDALIGNVLGTLQGVDGQQNDWDITGANVGTVTVGATTYGFSGFGNLLGGSAIDNFVLQNGGSISGLIDGGLGNNSLISNNSLANSWVLTALYAGTLNGDAFSNIQSIVGNSGVSDTLTGINQANDWQITGVDSGTVGEDGVGTSIAFSGMENLTGNDGSDDFTVADGARISGLINGGNGSNSLTSNNSLANSWILTALYAGTLNGDAFSNIQSLVGNSGVSDTLTGINQANDWQITGTNTGTVGEDGVGTSIAFSGMENLVGNDASDDFTVADGARISGLINGGNGSNSLTSNNSLANSWILTALYAGTLNGDAFSNIQSLVGNSGVSDTLTGINQANDWQITGTNAGSVGEDGVGTSIAFSGMENLVGNEGNDRFTLNAQIDSLNAGNGDNTITVNNAGAVVGAITAGTGIDTVTFNGAGTAGSLSTGAGDDVITIVDNSSVSGLIDGGADNDSVTITGSDVTITLGTDVANTETLTAGGGTNTLVGADNGGNTWLIDATNSVNDGTTTTVFSNFSILTAGNGGDDFTVNVAGIDTINGDTGDDVFTLLTAGLVGTINGNTGTDSLTVTSGDNTWSSDNNGDGNVFVTGVPADISNFTSVENLTGGSGTDSIDLTGFGSATIQLANYLNFDALIGNVLGTLQGVDGQQNDWDITGANVGTVTVGATTYGFSGFGNLLGGSAIDNFVLQNGGSISGLIDGGLGNNSLTSNNSLANSWVLTALYAGTLNGDAFSNIQSIVGNSGVSDTLTGINQANDWQITGVDSGTVGEDGVGTSIAFSGMENLTGNDGSDDFTVADGARISGLINGGNGSNSLTSNNSLANSWILTALYAGTLNGDAFSNIQSLVGNSGVSDTLTGINQANDWQITGTNAGTVGEDGVGTSIAFSGMENLVGNDASDDFTVADGARISGLINGGNGSNSLTSNNSLANSWILTALYAGTLNGDAFSNIQSLVGNSGVSDTLTGINQANDWQITGTNAGTVGEDGVGTSIAFSGMENLVGNEGNDRFTLNAQIDSLNAGNGDNTITVNNAGAVVGAITAGTGIDTVTFNGAGTAGSLSTGAGDDVITIVDNSSVSGLIDGGADNDSVTITGSDVTITLGTDVANTETLTAGGGTNTLVGADNGGNTWLIDATNSVNDGTTTTVFSNFSILTAGNGGDNFTVNVAGIDTINGDTGNDVFTLDTAGLVNTINGGNGDDRLSIVNGNSIWTVDLADDGSVAVDGSPLVVTNFTSIETREGSLAGTDSIDLTSFGNAIIQLANYLNFDLIIGNVLGTLQGLDGQQNDWDITGANVGTVTVGATTYGFSGFGNLLGGSAIDNFVLQNGGSISGLIDGGLGNNSLTSNNSLANSWVLTALYAGTLNGDAFSNIQSIVGNSGVSDTLTGINQANDWQITGVDSGTVGEDGVGTSIAFSGMENLTGNDGSDDFTVADGARISGLINGGNGSNSLTSNNSLANSWILTALYAGTLNGDAFSNIQSLVGNSGVSDTLSGINQANDWQITGVDSGTVGEDGVGTSIAFSGMENLVGNDASDDFTVADGARISGLINGGNGSNSLTSNNSLANSWILTALYAGTLNGDAFSNIQSLVGNSGVSDTLTGINQANDWQITGTNAGSVGEDGVGTSIAFSGMENLVGNANDDNFQFVPGGSISGSIDGGAHINADTLDYSLLASVDIDLNTDLANVSNIEQIQGNNTASTLTGRNVSNTWLISGANIIDIDGITFSGFNNLVGGSAADLFVVAEGGSISGLIDGGLGTNTLQRTNTSGSNLWEITGQHQGTLNGNAFSNIQSLIGSADAVDTLTGRNQNNNWDISGTNSGSVSETGSSPTDLISFSEMENLNGGNADDRFRFATSGSVTGLIDGGDHVNGDIVDYSLQADVNITLANAFNGVQNAEIIQGNNVNSTLTGDDAANTWLITGENEGSVASITFIGFNNLIGGNGNDLFNLAQGGSITGLINGGGGSNTLQRSNTSGDNTWVITGQHAGTINGNSFSNIQTLTGSASVNDTLIGRDQNNDWDITGNDSGTVAEAVVGPSDLISFSEMENLTGGSGDDRFRFATAGVISGIVDAGGHVNGDIVDYSLQAVVDITVSNAFNGVLNAEFVQGNNTNSTLTANNVDNTWLITGVNDGSVAGINFIDFNNLVGGSADDLFNLAEGGAITGIINGSGGANTLQRSNTTGDNVWVITGQYSGTLNGGSFLNIQTLTGSANANDTLTGRDQDNNWDISNTNSGTVAAAVVTPTDLITFSEMENLNGGSGDDRFRFAPNGLITGLIDAGAHVNGDIVDYSLQAQVNVNIANALNGVQNAEIVQGNNFDSTLTASDVSNTWIITGENDGSVAGITFIDFNILIGGSADDLFNLTEGGFITGLINGGAGTNTLQRTNTTGNNEWILTSQHSGTINGDAFSNIQNIIGSSSVVDTLTARNQNNNWMISGTDSGSVSDSSDTPLDTITFSDIENLNGGTGDDRFIFTDAGSISGAIDAGAHTTGDVVDYSLRTSVDVDLTNGINGIQNAEIVVGNNLASTLTAADVDNTWLITGENDGSVGGISFVDFNILNGGSANDLFNLAQGGSVTGTINGGAGANTLQRSNTSGTNEWIITGQYQGTLNGGDFVNIQTLVGSANAIDTLSGRDQNNNWDLNGVNSGTVAEAVSSPSDLITFSEMENLNGGSGDDRFRFAAGGSVTGSIDAGDHINGDIVDYSLQTVVNVSLDDAFNSVQNAEIIQGNNTDSTLNGADIINSWLITGENTGTIAGITFIGFNNLLGGSADDLFNLAEGGFVTGTIDGGAGNNTLQRSNTSGSNLWVISATHSGTINGNAFANIQNLVGSDTAVDTLVGRDQNNNWLITGTDLGSVSEAIDSPTDLINFSSMENLTGGNGDDRFSFMTGALISGIIDAGDHINGDIVDYSLQDTVSLTLADAFNGVQNAEIVQGNNVDSTLIGDNIANSWLITGENDGTVNGIVFIDFNNITGGTNVDVFTIQDGGTITGIINGGSGAGVIDILDLTALTTGVTVGVDESINADFTILGIEQLDANASDTVVNTIIASNTSNIWNIDGTNAGTLNLPTQSISFSGFANLTGGTSADIFNLNNADHITGLIDGGGGVGDELNMLGLGRDIIVQLGAVAGVSSSDTLYVNNIETILANSSRNNTINGLDVASRWAIDTTGLSTVESALTPSPDSTVAFSGFSVISGGIADDTFEIIDATGIVQINGGEGSGIDSIDYSNTMADVNVVIGDSIVPDTVNITGIEGLIGNGDGTSGFNSTISVIDGDNVWTISDFDGAGMADGINDGQFQDAEGNIISFIDFNIIQGGSGNDFFDIQNGGSVTGYIHGGAGNDELRLSFNTSGQVSFIGGEGDDSVLLSGGGDDFDATYTSNVNGAEVLNYQNTSGVTYAFSFDEVESVVDNVEAVNFTIFGSTGADLIDISTGNVTVNGGTTVQFNNRTNLILSGESNDTFDLVGDLDLGNGNLTLLNSLLTNSSGSLLSADALVLDSVAGAGTQGSRINTDINTLSITNAVGDVYLAEADSIVLDSIDTSGVFDLVANGAVSQLAGTVLTSSNNFAVSTTGSIDLDNSNQLSGAVSLSTDGDITFRNAVATDFAAINARNFNLNVVGDITDSGTIIVTDTLTIEANGNDIILDNATNNFNIINVTSANNATFSDIESLVLNDINVDNLLQVNAENLSTAADISVGAITINATGDVQINNNLQSLLGNIVINAGDFVQNANIESVADITLVSEQSITMASSTSSTANAGNISYTANGNVDLALLTTSGGTVSVTSSTGEIVDNNDDVDNIVANRAELIAQNGIGADNALETQLANLFAENDQGQIRIDNRGNIILERLATSGDITFNNADFEGSDISFMPGSVDAGYDVGSLVMTTEGGSFLGIGETPDFENADIVARDAAFLDSTLSGTFGSITRPLVLRIRDSVLITVRTSLNPQFAQPLPEIDDSGSLFRFSSFDAVSAIAGGQLVEVEELVEVDPAIFTDLTNYYSDEVAVRLPRDQLYEEDDEEEDEYPLIEADAAAGM